MSLGGADLVVEAISGGAVLVVADQFKFTTIGEPSQFNRSWSARSESNALDAMSLALASFTARSATWNVPDIQDDLQYPPETH